MTDIKSDVHPTYESRSGHGFCVRRGGARDCDVHTKPMPIPRDTNHSQGVDTISPIPPQAVFFTPFVACIPFDS